MHAHYLVVLQFWAFNHQHVCMQMAAKNKMHAQYILIEWLWIEKCGRREDFQWITSKFQPVYIALNLFYSFRRCGILHTNCIICFYGAFGAQHLLSRKKRALDSVDIVFVSNNLESRKFTDVHNQICDKHTKHKIIWPEDLSKWARADRVHSARLQVHQDGTRDIFVSCEIK